MSVWKTGFIFFELVFAQKATWQHRQKHKSLNTVCVIYSSLWNSWCNSICVSNVILCISSHPLLDPRRQLAPVTLLLLYSGQSSAPYRGHPATPNTAAQQSAAHRNRSCLLPLTQTPLCCVTLCLRTTSLLGCKVVCHQRARCRVREPCMRSNGRPARRRCVCGTPRPKWPKENSVLPVFIDRCFWKVFLWKKQTNKKHPNGA